MNRKEIKKSIKEFKEDMKIFKKVSKTDSVKGVELAKGLMFKIECIENQLGGFKKDQSIKKKMAQVKEILNVYIKSAEGINKFKLKWQK